MTEQGPTAAEALALLKEGNARYVDNKPTAPNRGKERRMETTKHGQKPFAGIVSCADSRVPVEILFDRGLGDLFIVRVAGNICGPSTIGSMEYAVLHVGIPLLVVLGHSNCGAVTAVVKGEEVHGSIVTLARRIVPAVDKTKADHPGLETSELVEQAAKENVRLQMETLLTTSADVRAAVESGSLELLGAYYDILTGEVTWMES